VTGKNVELTSVEGNKFKFDISEYGLFTFAPSGDKNEYCYINLYSDGKRDIAIKAYLPLLIDREGYVPKYEVQPKFVFDDTTTEAWKIHRIEAEFTAENSDYMDSLYYYKSNNISGGRYVNRNGDIVLTRLKERLKKEKSADVRAALYMTYLNSKSMIYPEKLDSSICADILKEIKPNSIFWSFGSQLIEFAVWGTEDKTKYRTYIDEALIS